MTSKQQHYPAWPHFAEDEIAAVEQVLRSGKVNYWTGTQCREFERAFADYSRVKHAIAVANGTVALELALYGLGIGPGDEVIVPCRGFIATASCVVQRGAIPVLADVDPYSQNISLETILPHITSQTRAIIVVHHAGWPVDLAPILDFCRDNGLKLIEDCAQSHGAKYQGQPIGSFGDVAAFSFCQDKIMTTGGEGGMVLTSDESLWREMWAYKDHGKSYAAVYEKNHPPGYRWLHERFGTNWRMTEIQAAIGLAQLTKLDGWIQTRRENANVLADGLDKIAGISAYQPQDPACYHAYYKFYAFIDDARRRDAVLESMQAAGIPCFVGSCANFSHEKAFTSLSDGAPVSMPVSEKLGQHSLVFLVHPGCDAALMRRICEQLEQVLNCNKSAIQV